MTDDGGPVKDKSLFDYFAAHRPELPESLVRAAIDVGRLEAKSKKHSGEAGFRGLAECYVVWSKLYAEEMLAMLAERVKRTEAGDGP